MKKIFTTSTSHFMNVHIRDTAGLWIDVTLADDCTCDLIDALEMQLGIPRVFMKLIFKGKILKYNSHLLSYGIVNNSVLVLYHKIPISDEAIGKLKGKMTEQIQQIDSSIDDSEIDDYAELNLKLIQNPSLAIEISRITDVIINNVERMNGGFNELVKMYAETEEEPYIPKSYPTYIPRKAECPSTTPLPTMFSYYGKIRGLPDEEQYHSNERTKLKKTENEEHVHQIQMLGERFY